MLERMEIGIQNSARPTVLLLHDAQGRPDQLVEFAHWLGKRRVVIPRAPRWAGARGTGIYSWFTSPGRGLADPVGFGDSLAQLELLLAALTDDGVGAKLGAVGFGQGAAAIAALAALWPERFAWLALAGGFWVDLPLHLLPHRTMGGLPVLASQGADCEAFDACALARRGAQVTDGSLLAGDMKAAIRGWIEATEKAMEVCR